MSTIQTFGYKQALSSQEFGALGYLSLKKGVYAAPTCTISGSNLLSITGGDFLLIDSSNKYCVRYIQDPALSLTKQLQSGDSGKYVYVKFSYASSVGTTPTVEIESTLKDPITAVDYVRIGKLYTENNVIKINVSGMEKAGDNLSCPHRTLEMYDTTDHRTVTAPVQTMSGVQTVNSTNANRGANQYVYIDQAGVPQVANAAVPRYGKLVVVESDGTPINFPVRAEINATSLEVKDLASYYTKTYQSFTSALQEEIYTKSKDTTSGAGSTIALAKIIEEATKAITSLDAKVKYLMAKTQEIEIWKNNMSQVLEYDSSATDPTVRVKPQATGSVTIPTLRIDGAFTFGATGTSSFGTSSSPIGTLYVSDTLYTDTLSLTSQQ